MCRVVICQLGGRISLFQIMFCWQSCRHWEGFLLTTELTLISREAKVKPRSDITPLLRVAPHPPHPLVSHCLPGLATVGMYEVNRFIHDANHQLTLQPLNGAHPCMNWQWPSYNERKLNPPLPPSQIRTIFLFRCCCEMNVVLPSTRD